MTIGVFGGTFDPPHAAHLIIAEYVRGELGLDHVLFVPAAVPPHKTQGMITPGHHRLEMVRLAIRGNTAFEVSDMELRRGGISYTVDTLDELARKRPGDTLFLLIGEDNLVEFGTWKEPERILKLAQVIAMTRPGFAVEPTLSFHDAIKICEVPQLGIASRDIRERLRAMRTVRYLVPDPVVHYIRMNKLYGAGV